MSEATAFVKWTGDDSLWANVAEQVFECEKAHKSHKKVVALTKKGWRIVRQDVVRQSIRATPHLTLIYPIKKHLTTFSEYGIRLSMDNDECRRCGNLLQDNRHCLNCCGCHVCHQVRQLERLRMATKPYKLIRYNACGNDQLCLPAFSVILAEKPASQYAFSLPIEVIEEYATMEEALKEMEIQTKKVHSHA